MWPSTGRQWSYRQQILKQYPSFTTSMLPFSRHIVEPTEFNSIFAKLSLVVHKPNKTTDVSVESSVSIVCSVFQRQWWNQPGCRTINDVEPSDDDNHQTMITLMTPLIHLNDESSSSTLSTTTIAHLALGSSPPWKLCGYDRQWSTANVGRTTVANTIVNVFPGLQAFHVRRHVFYTYITLMVGRPDQSFQRERAAATVRDSLKTQVASKKVSWNQSLSGRSVKVCHIVCFEFSRPCVTTRVVPMWLCKMRNAFEGLCMRRLSPLTICANLCQHQKISSFV